MLALVLGNHEGDGEREEDAQSAKEEGRDGRGERGSAGGRVIAWFQSQRSHYLRVILDAEREIARLMGLYESGWSYEGAVVFRIERGLPRRVQVAAWIWS